MKKYVLPCALPLALLPAFAEAHVGLHMNGMLAGSLHPFTGLDHMLTMTAVGFWAAELGRSKPAAVWFVPLVFVMLMMAGACLGFMGLALPHAETVIGASVVVLGLLVAFEVQLPLALASLIVGGFALFHGYAHGVEMPDVAEPVAYAAGFLGSTLLLHLLGIAIGFARYRFGSVLVSRMAGIFLAASGVVLLTN